jgi:hypothetical protein
MRRGALSPPVGDPVFTLIKRIWSLDYFGSDVHSLANRSERQTDRKKRLCGIICMLGTQGVLS